MYPARSLVQGHNGMPTLPSLCCKRSSPLPCAASHLVAPEALVAQLAVVRHADAKHACHYIPVPMHMGACAQVRFGMRYGTVPVCSPFYKSAWNNSPCKADLQRLRAVGEGAAYQRSGMPAALAEVRQAVSSVPSAVHTRNNVVCTIVWTHMAMKKAR